MGDTSPGQAHPWEKQMTYFCRISPKLTTAAAAGGEKHCCFVFLALQPDSSFSHHLASEIKKPQVVRKTQFSADLVTSLLEQPRAQLAEGTSSKATLPPIPAGAGSCPQCAVVSSAGGTKAVVVG